MNYKSWLSRVMANCIDAIVVLPFFSGIAFLGTPDEPTTIGAVLTLVALVVFGYNRWYLAGRTGRSWGRMFFGGRLVSDRTGRPIGFGMAFVRDLAHLLDSATFFVGYLLPLVTSKKQTLADMVCGTVVVKESAAAVPSPGAA
ncbi:RDD family protein [Actinoplanes couchii]|uniref:RDD domain-containing protein n=1 Tax=Actinoplanes couchii TaxID=403638 RepID=A0ABQ3XQQ9_9ACTN|nr:RDD family protein [Actinoplanes couchii]MDR6318825.1 putative RDD family membrane protein YckC [Actinoplanes couchii]GID60856.1 hypothetical protein Aco03nite_092600 [Actinoplanes couchii]